MVIRTPSANYLMKISRICEPAGQKSHCCVERRTRNLAA